MIDTPMLGGGDSIPQPGSPCLKQLQNSSESAMRTLPAELPGSAKIEIGAGNLRTPAAIRKFDPNGDRDELHSGTILPSPNQKAS